MDIVDYFYFNHTPAGLALMEQRRVELVEGQRLIKDEILASADGQQMVKEKLEESEGNYALAVRQLRQLRTAAATCPDEEDWWYQWMIELHEGKVKKYRSKIWRWRMLVRMEGEDGLSPTSEQAPVGFDFAAIKEIPIDGLIPYGPTWRSDLRWTYRCPIHNEKTASFVWYRDQNTWHCFGCSEGGSVIDLVMKIENITFIEACRRLTS